MSPSRWSLWRDRFVRLWLAGAASAVTAAGSVVRNKWLALHLETAGLGVIGQVTAGQTWLGTLTGLGLTTPLARVIGAARARGDQAAVRRALSTALVVLSGATAVVVALGLLAAPWISLALLGTAAHATLVRVSMLAVAGLAFQGTVQGLFAGHSDVRAPFVYALGGNLASVGLVLVLVPRFGLAGAVWALAAYWPAAIASALWMGRADYREAFAPAPCPRFDGGEARALLKVAAAALALALCDQGAMLALRAHHVRASGLASNGLFQAAFAVAQMTGAAFYAYLSSYAFGRISGMPDAAAVRDYTRRQWLPLVGLAAAAVALLMVAATPVLHLFYSERFDAARPMVAWMLFGEFTRVATQTWALGALPLGGVRLWVPIGVAGWAGMVVVYVVARALGLGERSLAVAYAGGGLLALLVTAALMGRRGVTLAARDLAALALALAALGALAAWVAR